MEIQVQSIILGQFDRVEIPLVKLTRVKLPVKIITKVVNSGQLSAIVLQATVMISSFPIL